MKKSEFMAEITGYYGDFQNDTVAKRFVMKLNKINDSDLDKLLEWFFDNIPAKWPVDVTTLTKGVNSCTIFLQEEKKRCPICTSPNIESAKFCCNCGYDFSIPAEEYRKTLVAPEVVAKSFQNIFKGLEENKAKIYTCRDCLKYQYCPIQAERKQKPCMKISLREGVKE